MVLILIFKGKTVICKEPAKIVNKEKPDGTYEVIWNAADVSSGVYF